jgi:hypothetical protein
MTREAALERASRLVPRTWELLQECRTVRGTLEDERLPPPDITTEAEAALYLALTQALERSLIQSLEDVLTALRAMQGVAATEAAGWLRRQLEGLAGPGAGERRE